MKQLILELDEHTYKLLESTTDYLNEKEKYNYTIVETVEHIIIVYSTLLLLKKKSS